MTSPFSAASMQSLIDVRLSDEQRLCNPRTEIRGVLFLSEFNLYCSRREITNEVGLERRVQTDTGESI